MKTETDQFIIDRVQWAYTQSQEITGDRMQRQAPMRSAVESMDVVCKRCGRAWRADECHGLMPAIGGTRIHCECGAEGSAHPS
jgi:hypothetical protein